MKVAAFVVMLVLSVSVLGACGQGEVKERVEDTIMRTSNEQKEKSDKEQRAEKIAKDFKEVKGAIAYDTEDELVVAFHVTQYQKFFTEKIEKKVKKALEKEFPDENVVVSHDLKIRLEIERLRRNVEQQDISEKELEKRIEKMKTLREEKA
ncbi:YhcN/YlaJ family sporulation lipoprotein [Sutcliffiella horikoshii]|uniref:YhcN/YlaJ family sporulation lipoprotein n=1 Tax=Sutcliffiella horikoshii TaxID=79883 RepID=UPI003CEAB5A3